MPDRILRHGRGHVAARLLAYWSQHSVDVSAPLPCVHPRLHGSMTTMSRGTCRAIIRRDARLARPRVR
ncbi:hypothetical protein AB0C18_37655 [Nonomuraea muscovyensis]|uniref:hypothetical protein n=1 Tax=Nonomuraea muscovyensis TaxID=1124761 RepID=UPI0033C7535B